MTRLPSGWNSKPNLLFLEYGLSPCWSCSPGISRSRTMDAPSGDRGRSLLAVHSLPRNGGVAATERFVNPPALATWVRPGPHEKAAGAGCGSLLRSPTTRSRSPPASRRDRPSPPAANLRQQRWLRPRPLPSQGPRRPAGSSTDRCRHRVGDRRLPRLLRTRRPSPRAQLPVNRVTGGRPDRRSSGYNSARIAGRRSVFRPAQFVVSWALLLQP
jgi:hypothetical protein